MSALEILMAQAARLAINNVDAALALLPSGVRQSVQTLADGIPNLRQRLDAQWADLNNTIEGNWTGLTPAQAATMTQRVTAKRAALDEAQAAMNQIDQVLAAAAGTLTGMGVPVSLTYPLFARGLSGGLGAGPGVAVGAAILIIAVAAGGSLLLLSYGKAARGIANAEQISLGNAPIDPPDFGIGSIGMVAVLIAGVVGLLVLGKRT